MQIYTKLFRYITAYGRKYQKRYLYCTEHEEMSMCHSYIYINTFTTKKWYKLQKIFVCTLTPNLTNALRLMGRNFSKHIFYCTKYNEISIHHSSVQKHVSYPIYSRVCFKTARNVFSIVFLSVMRTYTLSSVAHE